MEEQGWDGELLGLVTVCVIMGLVCLVFTLTMPTEGSVPIFIAIFYKLGGRGLAVTVFGVATAVLFGLAGFLTYKARPLKK